MEPMPDAASPRAKHSFAEFFHSRPAFLIAVVTILVVEILFASGKELFGTVNFGLHGPGGYWAFQWPRDYSHGFVRRGLLGEVLRRVGLDSSNYLTVTLLSWSVSLLLYGLFARSVRRLLVGVPGQDSLVFLLVLLLSPVTTGMFLEITGDPLQVVLLLYLLLHLLLVHVKLPSYAEVLLCFSFGVVSVLIHEASLFFFAPAIGVVCLVLARRVRLAPVAGYLCGALPAAAIVVLATQHNDASATLPLLHWHNIVVQPGPDQYPSFSTLIATDNKANFGQGFRGVAKMGYRFFACLILPLFLSVFLVRQRFGKSEKASQTATRAILIPAVCCLPLFLIAHDWGRFFSFQFILAITHLAAWKPETETVPLALRSPEVALAVLIAGVTTTPVALTYRVLGLSDSRPIYFTATIAILCFCYVVRGPSAGQKAADS